MEKKEFVNKMREEIAVIYTDFEEFLTPMKSLIDWDAQSDINTLLKQFSEDLAITTVHADDARLYHYLRDEIVVLFTAYAYVVENHTVSAGNKWAHSMREVWRMMHSHLKKELTLISNAEKTVSRNRPQELIYEKLVKTMSDFVKVTGQNRKDLCKIAHQLYVESEQMAQKLA